VEKLSTEARHPRGDGGVARIVQLFTRPRSALQNGYHALPAGGADGDQPALARTGLVQQLGQVGDDAPASGGEGVAGGQGTALDVELAAVDGAQRLVQAQDRKSTRLNSSHVKISYAVFCLKKKTNI